MRSLIYFVVLTLSLPLYSQESPGDTLVNFGKHYTPIIEPGKKLHATTKPIGKIKKLQPSYSIISAPVSHTYSPSIPKQIDLEISDKSDIPYGNAIKTEIGSYFTRSLSLYSTQALKERLSILLNHNGINSSNLTRVDNDFSEWSLQAGYHEQNSKLEWKTFGGLNIKDYNFYGIPTDLSLNGNETALSKVGATSTKGYFNTHLMFNDSKTNIKDLGLHVHHLDTDPFNTEELFIKLSSSYRKTIRENHIMSDALINVQKVNTFTSSYTPLSFTDVNIKFSGGLQFNKEYSKLYIGLKLQENIRDESTENTNTFKVYPDIQASYMIVKNLVVAHARLTGDLKTNTYSQLMDENLFLNPALTIKPTDQKYMADLEIDIKPFEGFVFKNRIRFLSENDKILIKHKTNPNPPTNNNGYDLNNSFETALQNIKTTQFFSEISYMFNDNINLKANVEYNTYKSETSGLIFYNLPKLTANLFLNFKIKKYDFNINAIHMGEREDLDLNGNTTTLDNFTDLSLRLGHHFKKSAFGYIKFNNLLSKNYERWIYYPTQGFIVTGGFIYKFDV